MSRAEARRIPPPAQLGRSVREAGIDLYYSSIRFVVANVAWALALVGVGFVATRWLPGLVLVIALIPISAGLMGMAAALVRNGHVVLSDFTAAMRRELGLRLLLGVAQLFLVAVAVVDLLVGLQTAGLLGLVLVVVAAYTLAAIWIAGVTIWPIVVDPLRAAEPMTRRLRLGILLLLAHPVRMTVLAALVGLILVVSAVAIAALVTLAGAFVALIAARYVLPAADRLEGRATVELAD